ncbi:hypothetical protein SCHPADRAFT_694239 [Schizopora paradoxa]|uniref:Uncharacterized protein n=1 Tax=Schizopora paradoxa TaxID=27342 RepID=A0A0H2R4L1_9AGAM|nr:hypothetical protein SCHPADRAFT_694239 [Schizopora paradoxa]
MISGYSASPSHRLLSSSASFPITSAHCSQSLLAPIDFAIPSLRCRRKNNTSSHRASAFALFLRSILLLEAEEDLHTSTEDG